MLALWICVPIGALLVVVIVVFYVIHRRRIRKQKQERQLILSKLDDLENKTRETARNGKQCNVHILQL